MFCLPYFVFILVLQSSRWRKESRLFFLFVFLVSHDCYVALPRDAVGLSAVVMVVFPDHTHCFTTVYSSILVRSD